MFFKGADILQATPANAVESHPFFRVYVWEHDWNAETLKAFCSEHFPEVIFNDLADTYKADKRLVEKLSVRLLLHLMMPHVPRHEYRATGQPFLPHSPYSISISHTRHVYAVSIGTQPHGIDVEQWSGKAARVGSQFLSERENEWLAAMCTEWNVANSTLSSTKEPPLPLMTNDAWYTVLWSAKEAVYKCFSELAPRLKDDITLHPKHPGPATGLLPHIFAHVKQVEGYFPITYELHPHFVLTICHSLPQAGLAE